jgi:hypothetical protein
MGIKTCIYCKQNDPEKFKGVEHVVPQAFGIFGTATPTLNCVCDDCNGYFGKNHDLYLARETIEGVLRYKKGISSSEARPQKHLHIALEAGPETGQFAGMKVAIDGTSGELMKVKAQFQILNKKTGLTEFYFKHQLTNLELPEDVYGKPGNNDIKGTWICNIFAPSKEEHDEIIAILQAKGIPFVPGEPFLIPEPTAQDSSGKHTVPLSIEGEIGLEHRQAHAKIFLNFIAKYLGCDEAVKPDWDFLRRYARFGEGTIKYRVTEDPVLPSEKEDELRRLIGESIVIQIQNMKEHIVGTIRFYGNQTYQYILRENASIPDEHEFGFMFTDGKKPAPLITGKNLGRLIEEELTEK